MLAENLIKRKSYFVQAAIDMIRETGLDSLSARTVARAAGFNGASVYTYFENMDHLVALACVYYIQDYVHDMLEALPQADSWLERDMVLQNLFLKHALAAPNIYCKVYYPAVDAPWGHTLHKEFYEMFPQYFPSSDNIMSDFIVMDNASDNYHRNMYFLTRAEEEGSIKKGGISPIYELHEALTYHALHRSLFGQEDLDVRRRNTMKTLLTGIYYFVTEPYRDLVEDRLKAYE